MFFILYGIQDKIGYILVDVVLMIVGELNVLCVEVYGVILFYYFFCQELVGCYVVQVCCVEVCQVCGSEVLVEYVQNVLGCGFYEISVDGQFMLELVYCLGQCVIGFNFIFDDVLYVCVDVDKFKCLIQVKWEV